VLLFSLVTRRPYLKGPIAVRRSLSLKPALGALLCGLSLLGLADSARAAPVLAQLTTGGHTYTIDIVGKTPAFSFGGQDTYTNAVVKDGTLNQSTGAVTGGTIVNVAVTTQQVSLGGVNALQMSVTFSGASALPGFTSLNLTFQSNSPGGPLSANMTSTSIEAIANANTSLTIAVSDTGFTNPVGNPLLLTNTNPTGSATTTTAGEVITSQAYFANSNLYMDTSASAQTPGQQSFTENIVGNNSYGTGSVSQTVNRTGSAFSLTYVGTATFKAGDNFTINNTVTVTPVPVPATAVLVLIGTGGLGGFSYLRRRKAQAVAGA